MGVGVVLLVRPRIFPVFAVGVGVDRAMVFGGD